MPQSIHILMHNAFSQTGAIAANRTESQYICTREKLHTCTQGMQHTNYMAIFDEHKTIYNTISSHDPNRIRLNANNVRFVQINKAQKHVRTLFIQLVHNLLSPCSHDTIQIFFYIQRTHSLHSGVLQSFTICWTNKSCPLRCLESQALFLVPHQ